MLLSVLERVLLLEEVEVLATLPGRGLMELARRAAVCSYREGELVLVEGDEDARLCVLVSGRAAVVRGGRTYATLGPRDYCGELALFGRRSNPVSVMACSDLIVISLGRADLLAALAKEPDIAPNIMQGLTRAVRARMLLSSATTW